MNIPPNSDGAIYKSHCRDLEIIFNRFIDSDFIIAGDFNLPKVNWNDDFNLIRSECENFEILMSTYTFLNLNQVNKYPNNRNVFLDLVFTNIPNLDIQLTLDPLLDSSFHHMPYYWSLSS